VRSARCARHSSAENWFSSKLPAISGVAASQSRRGSQPGDKACSDIASTYRKERSPTRNALASELPFTFFEARGINSAIVVYVYACMSRSTCDKPTLGSWRGTWLRRPRKRRRQRRRPPRRRSNLRRHTVLLLRHIKARARFSHREPISPLLDVIQGHQYPGRTTTRDMC
jgi:hypothetical protein